MEAALERITALAAELAGVSAEEAASAASAAAKEAMAWCRRNDIPEGMESAVARIAADMMEYSGAASIREGDIQISFDGRTPLERNAAALTAFRRIA